MERIGSTFKSPSRRKLGKHRRACNANMTILRSGGQTCNLQARCQGTISTPTATDFFVIDSATVNVPGGWDDRKDPQHSQQLGDRHDYAAGIRLLVHDSERRGAM